MRYSVTILLLLLSTATIFSQDHIITKNGKDLEVTITEIRQTDVTFTMYNDTSKTPFVMDKTEIEKIVFENGTEERFGDQNNETIINNAKFVILISSLIAGLIGFLSLKLTLKQITN